MEQKCDRCLRKLVAPFTALIFNPDGTESKEANKIILNHVGVVVYIHDNCNEQIVKQREWLKNYLKECYVKRLAARHQKLEQTIIKGGSNVKTH